jgi:two-component system response regulator AlgR
VRILIVDDEALARSRLQALLEDAAQDQVSATDRPAALDFPGLSKLQVVQAQDALQAMALLHKQPFDVVFLDINMPGASGLQLARELAQLPKMPLLVFVTAHAEYALQAFELDALDYLSKPVTAVRLTQTLQKITRQAHSIAVTAGNSADGAHAAEGRVLVIQERGRVLRLPLSQVLYLRAELKYLTVRTIAASHLLDGSLNDIEQLYGDTFLRTHRSVLVAKHAMLALEKQHDGEEGWALRLQGIPELLPVSRRQLASVRQAMRL